MPKYHKKRSQNTLTPKLNDIPTKIRLSGNAIFENYNKL